MKTFFNLENPVWEFIGNLADLFLLSVLWYLCCLPIFTAGSASTALYYVTLKMVCKQEGYTAHSFLKAFRANLRQSTMIWLVCVAGIGLLCADVYWSLCSGNYFASALLPAFLILSLLFAVYLTFLFPLLARCDNSAKTLMGMCVAISFRDFLPILSALILTVGIFSAGLFLFWPLLLIAPGLAAYLNSFIFHRILEKYHLDLPTD